MELPFSVEYTVDIHEKRNYTIKMWNNAECKRGFYD